MNIEWMKMESSRKWSKMLFKYLTI